MTKRCADALAGRSITDGAHEWANRLAQALVPPGNGSTPVDDQLTRSVDVISWRSTNPAPVAYAYQVVSPVARNTNGSGKSIAFGPSGVVTTTGSAASPPGAVSAVGAGAVVVVVVVVVIGCCCHSWRSAVAVHTDVRNAPSTVRFTK